MDYRLECPLMGYRMEYLPMGYRSGCPHSEIPMVYFPMVYPQMVSLPRGYHLESLRTVTRMAFLRLESRREYLLTENRMGFPRSESHLV